MQLMKTLGRVQLLIPVDLGLTPLTGEQRRDLLEIVDDRHERGSTIVISQVPVDHWHEVIGGPTIAGAVVDRLGIDVPMEDRHRAAAGSQRARASRSLSVILCAAHCNQNAGHPSQSRTKSYIIYWSTASVPDIIRHHRSQDAGVIRMMIFDHRTVTRRLWTGTRAACRPSRPRLRPPGTAR